MLTKLLKGAAAVALIGALLVLFTPKGLFGQTTGCPNGILNCFTPPDATGNNAMYLWGSVFLGSSTASTQIQTTQVAITNAQVLALNTTPITIIAAPAAGYAIDVIRVWASLHYVAAYTAGSANLRLYYGNRNSGNAASSLITASGLLTSVSADAGPFTVVGSLDVEKAAPATAVVIQPSTGAAYATGDPGNVLYIGAEYRVFKTGL